MAETVTGLINFLHIFTRKAKQISAIIVICIILEVALSSGAEVDDAATGAEILTGTNNSTNTTTDRPTKDDDGGKGNKGVIIAVCVIGGVICLVTILGVYLFKRRRQSMMMDKEKKMQIQMSSARNAGVYQDLTVSVPADEKPASPEHERLKAAEDA